MTDYSLKELSIEVTNHCAMNCIMCSSGSSDCAEDTNHLSQEEIMGLIVQGRELGASVLSLSGGDPITLPFEVYSKYVELAIEVGYERVLFYTTGISNTYKDIRYGAAYALAGGINIHWLEDVTSYSDSLTVIFSLHSHIANVNDYIMGVSGAFEEIVENILAIKRYTSAGVEVHMVPMLPNYQHIHYMVDLCEKVGADKVSFLRFVPQTRGKSNRRVLEMNVHEFVEMQKMLDTVATDPIYKDCNVERRMGCPIDFRHTVCKDITEKQHPCHAGKDLILIRPNGDVHPCAAWKTLPGSDDNVRTKSMKEIWEESEMYLTLRRFHEIGWASVQGICAICEYNESCKSGCMAQRLHKLATMGHIEIGSIYEPVPDPLCPIGHRAWKDYVHE